MSKRFVSWAAVSSLPQAKKISVDDQLQTNLEHIERWDGVLHKELPIRGKSRSIATWEKACATIPEYAQLRDMIERREFDVLIYLDRSRLGRKSRLIDAIVEECHDAGILTYSTESPPSSLEIDRDNFANKVVGAIESILAQQEVKTMMRRHEMGMAARVRDGDFPGRIPYGWKARFEIENDKPVMIVEVDDEAQATITLILMLYLVSGFSFRGIADHLIGHGMPPPREDGWSRGVIAGIIDMIWRYAGYVELNRKSQKREYIRAKSRWPALITEELAKQIVAERKRRAFAKRAVDSVHLFSQIVWCKQCNRKMHGRFNWRVSRKDPSIRTRVEDFVCSHEGKHDHPQWHINAKYLVDAVRKTILYLQDEGNREKVLAQYADRSPEIRQAIEKAKARLAKHEEAEERADNAYIILGKMSAERYQKQVEQLEAQRIKIEAEIERLHAELDAEQFDSQRPERLRELADNGLRMLESEDVTTANAWFRRHIKIWMLHDDPEYRLQVDAL